MVNTNKILGTVMKHLCEQMLKRQYYRKVMTPF